MAGSQLVLKSGEVALYLHHIGMRFLSQLLLFRSQLQRLLRRGHLFLQRIFQLGIIQHVAIRLHGGKADLVLGLLFLGQSHLLRGLGDLQVVDCLESVEQIHPDRQAIAIMEGGRQGVNVRLRVDGTTEIEIGVGVTVHRRGEGRQDGVAPVDLGIAVVCLLDAHLGGMFHSVAHTFFQVHRDGVLGLDVRQGTQKHHRNYKDLFSFHRTQLLTSKRESIGRAKITYNWLSVIYKNTGFPNVKFLYNGCKDSLQSCYTVKQASNASVRAFSSRC